MQTERVTFLTTPDHKAALDAFAANNGMSVGHVVREATTRYVIEGDMSEDDRFKLLINELDEALPACMPRSIRRSRGSSACGPTSNALRDAGLSKRVYRMSDRRRDADDESVILLRSKVERLNEELAATNGQVRRVVIGHPDQRTLIRLEAFEGVRSGYDPRRGSSDDRAVALHGRDAGGDARLEARRPHQSGGRAQHLRVGHGQ